MEEMCRERIWNSIRLRTEKRYKTRQRNFEKEGNV